MINTKLQNIIDTKSAIGNAIVNKGGTITESTPFYEYAGQIDNISTGGTFDLENSTFRTNTGEVYQYLPRSERFINQTSFNVWVLNNNADTTHLLYNNVISLINLGYEKNVGLLYNNTSSVNANQLRKDENYVYAINSTTFMVYDFNLTLINNVAVGGTSFVVDNDYIYIGGASSADIYYKNNLTYKNTITFPNSSRLVYVNNNFLYGTSGTRLARYNLLNDTTENINYGNTITTTYFDNNFIYVGGSFNNNVSFGWSVLIVNESNFGVHSNLRNLGLALPNIQNVLVDNEFIYVSLRNSANEFLRKYNKSNALNGTSNLVANTATVEFFSNNVSTMVGNNLYFFAEDTSDDVWSFDKETLERGTDLLLSTTANFVKSMENYNGYVYVATTTNSIRKIGTTTNGYLRVGINNIGD
jgi:hypothetical protein